jgi:hypothetical protein
VPGIRTFIVLAVVFVVGLRASDEQSRATENPCVQKANPNPRLLPFDEAVSHPQFLQYRTRLRSAVERRDIDAVVEAMDPNIKLDFGGAFGVEMFRRMVVDSPEMWEEMRWALAHGGGFMSEGLFRAPYVYSRWPDEFDSFECAAIVGSNAPSKGTTPRCADHHVDELLDRPTG